MEATLTDNDELAERRSFIGLAKVDLAALDFSESIRRNHRPVSQRKIERLLAIFETEGCKRLDRSNYVHALTDGTDLQAALEQGAVSRDALRDPQRCGIPPLPIRRLDCLDGLHRIQAARAYLDDEDYWWVVKLYSRGASSRFEAIPLIRRLNGCRTTRVKPAETDGKL